MSLSTKLILVLSLTVATILSIAVQFLIRQRENVLRQELERDVHQLTTTLKMAMENSLRDNHLRDVRNLVRESGRSERRWRVAIYDPLGRVLFSSDAAHPSATDIDSLLAGPLRQGGEVNFYSRDGTPAAYHAVVPLIDPGKNRILGVLEVVHQTAFLEKEIQKERWHMVGLLLLTLSLVVGAIGVMTRHQIARPISILMRGVEAIGRGDLDARLPVLSGDELGRLSHEFNRMAQNLREAHRRIQEDILREAELGKLAALGTLASGLAHEIGTPLGIVQGRAEVVLNELPAGSPHRHHLEVLIGQIDRINRIVQQLLQYARREPLSKAPVDIGKLLGSVLEFLEYQIASQGIKVAVEWDADLPTMRVDPDRMHQVFFNLCLNAIQAMPQGGILTVRASKTEKDGRQVLTVSVEDTGEGIPPEVLPRVFDPFFTTKSPGEGTGLGLAVVQGFVHDHGGWIETVSTVGRGSSFRVSLPLET